jgi:hypothetical protein
VSPVPRGGDALQTRELVRPEERRQLVEEAADEQVDQLGPGDGAVLTEPGDDHLLRGRDPAADDEPDRGRRLRSGTGETETVEDAGGELGAGAVPTSRSSGSPLAAPRTSER